MARKTKIDDDLAIDENDLNNWSDLPPDILSKIRTRLFVADEYAFKAVCKSWKAAPHTNKTPPTLTAAAACHPSACLMFFEPYNNRVKFFHPIYDHFFTKELPGLSDAKIKCSRYGWLLMSRPDFSLFFFNPISGSKIQLPDIPKERLVAFGSMCFTSPPTSDACLILGIDENHADAATGVLRRGQSQWDLNFYVGIKPGYFSESSPILHKGLYYCLGNDGRIGVYNPKDETFNVLGKRFKSRSYMCENFVLELDGDLAAVFVLERNDRRSIRLCKLDLKKMVWQDIQSLGDKMIYVSRGLSFAETATVNGMANKIYFPKICANTGVFYSMVTKKFHSFNGEVSSERACQEGNIPSSTWIVPAMVKTAEEELTW